jgi:hypothetical protein
MQLALSLLKDLAVRCLTVIVAVTGSNVSVPSWAKRIVSVSALADAGNLAWQLC